MKYLYLKFENAGLIIGDKINKHFVGKPSGEGELLNNLGYDLYTPIPWHVLSGALAKLCGEIPVPTKRETFFKRIEVLDDIAKNSFIQYDMKPIFNEDGYVTNNEIFKFSKTRYNTHKKIQTKLIDFNGNEKLFDGCYNWNYLHRAFINEEDYNVLIDFLSKIIGENCLSFTFEEFYKKITSKLGDEKIQEKIDIFLEENKKITNELKTSWIYVLFNRGKNYPNTSHSWRTILLYTNGVGYITYASGRIICPIENENVIKALNENSGVASILEGGILYILGLEDEPPIYNFEQYYERIFNPNQLQNTENEIDI